MIPYCTIHMFPEHMRDNRPSREVFTSLVQPMFAFGSYFLAVPKMCLFIAHISNFIFSRGEGESSKKICRTMIRDQTQNPLNLLVCDPNTAGFPFQDFDNVHKYFIRK